MSNKLVHPTGACVESFEPRRLLSAGLVPQAVAPAGGQVARPVGNTGSGFFVSGTQVYDANGYPFTIRGINHTTRAGDTAKNIAAIDEFDKTGANAVRTTFGTFGAGTTPAQRRSLVEQYLANGIVPIVEDHSATNGVTPSQIQAITDRWLQPDNKSWLKQYERNVILNIANEWGPDSTVWRDTYISSIARLRDAGINAMIMIDAGISGQSAHTVETWAQDIEDADPQHNVVFSIHMYGYWRTEGASDVGKNGSSPWDIATEMTKMKAAGLPVVAGEFSMTGGSDVPYDTRRAIEIFNGLGMGWMAWSWNQNGSAVHDLLSQTAGYQYDSDADLSNFGRIVFNDPVLGTQATARPATSLRPARISGALNDLSSSPVSGATVYIDDNDNGALDASERSIVTDGNGAFAFEYLPQGVHRLRVVNDVAAPNGVVPVNVALPAGDSVQTTLTLRDPNAPAAAASIHGTVFNDVSHDGYRGSTENGAGGQQVYLDLDNNGALTVGEPTTVTDNDGSFAFDGLAAGTYAVGVVVPAGMERTTGVMPFTLAADAQLVNATIGLNQPAALGRVSGVFFDDTNLNGVRDAGEAGLGFRDLFLDANGNGAFDSGEPRTLTAADGSYLFTRLTPGTYTPMKLSDGWQISTAYTPVAVQAFQTMTATPIGAKELTGSLGGSVFNDANANGQFDPGEAKASAGVQVYLDADGDNKFDAGETTTTTDANGAFTFTGMKSGTYNVRAVPPSGQGLTTGTVGFTLGSGKSYNGLALGLGVIPVSPTPPSVAAISGIYFNDANSNHRLDAAEAPISGAAVFLDSNDNGVFDAGEPTTTTAADGSFSFTGLAAGAYHLRTVVPNGYALVTPLIDVYLSQAQVFSVARFGVVPSNTPPTTTMTLQAETAALSGGTVASTGWTGYTGSGFADYAGSGSAVQWTFSQAAAGSATVSFRYANGSTTNRPLTIFVNGVSVGTVNFPGTGAWSTWGTTTPLTVSLTAGTNTLKAVAGSATGANVDLVTITQTTTPPPTNNASLSGIAFADNNSNAAYDAGDAFSNGAIIFLDADNDGVLDAGETKITTDSTGAFSFTGLAAGTYHIRRVFDATHMLSTPLIDVTLTAGQVKAGLAIGAKLIPAPPANTASLIGTAFNDNNKNAKYDTGDGIGKGITVFLDADNDGVLDAGETSVVTDSKGKFTFAALAAGTYHVRRVFAVGQSYSTPLIDVTLKAGQAKTGLLLGTKKT